MITAGAILPGLLGGCAGRSEFTTLPPIAIVESGGLGRGMWRGDRVLTALHVVDDGRRFPPQVVRLNGRAVHVVDVTSGLLEVVRSLDVDDDEAPEAWLEDWAALRVDARAEDAGDVSAGDGRVEVGEILYAVGQDLDDPSRYIGVPLRVTRPTWIDKSGERREVPAKLIVVEPFERRDFAGWSGSFVGRYEKRSGRWEYVGHVVMRHPDVTYPDALAVVRPPQDVVDWFFETGERGAGTAASRVRTFAPPCRREDLGEDS